MSRSSSLIAALAVASLALAPSLADARAGFGSSFGSRGSRTFTAPPATGTAPYAVSPMERSMTQPSAPSYGGPTPYAGGMPARSGFTSGLLGGLLGAGIGGMLFGHGLFGGGGFGFIGFILQLAIMFFIARWLLRTFFSRPVMAGPGMGGFARMGQPASGMMGGGGSAPRSVPIAIGPSDYQEFERMLQEVQAAWSAQDLRHLQRIASPEIVSYFSEQLSEQSSRGLHNTVTDVRLDKGDLSEAWSEGGRDYATVAMRFSMVDVTRDSNGRVVDGNPAQRTSATELWTFMRASGGRWLLSAIQQGR